MAVEPGRVMGLDYGKRRIGVALSDPLRMIARGAGTVENSSNLFFRLSEIVRRENVVLVVVGMPYAPDGGRGAQGEEVQRFVERLRETLALPVEMWDESRTSVDAARVLREAGMRQKKRRQKARVDEMAARILLQEYLESSYHRQ
jgi:putative Holliday junction resolvase